MRFAARLVDHLERELRSLPLDGSVADVARALGARADALGLPRPSYAAVRLHVRSEQLRRAKRDAAVEVAATLAFTRAIAPSPDAVVRAYDRALDRHRP